MNRMAEGFVRSLFQKGEITLPVPDHTILSRRCQTVHPRLPKRAESPLHLVLDSSGLKIYEEGDMTGPFIRTRLYMTHKRSK